MTLKEIYLGSVIARSFVLAVAGLVFQGCSPSTSKPSAENVATDIRGEPINSPTPASTQSVVQAGASTSTDRQIKSEPEKSVPTGKNGLASTAAKALGDPVKTAAEPVAEFTPVTFEKLASFTFEIPDEQPGTNKVSTASKSADQIPASVKALDQKRVALKGFMLPLKVEGGLVTEMLIMRDQSMCCYGTVPKITEWVSIKMTDKGVKAIMDQPVTIFGKLRVGEIRENGYLVGIYQMDGEKMAGPAEL